MEKTKLKELSNHATNIRIGAVTAVHSASSGHPGGSLSIAEILSYLYFAEMRVKPEDPKWEDRDRLVLSKGHCAPGLYAALAEKGFFPKEELTTFRHIDGRLQGHPDMKGTPGVDMTTGSLGLGISASVGMALSAKIRNKDYRVYAILGDGEIEEGQVWEAAMAAAHYKLDNLCAFIDWNGLQIDGPTAEVMNSAPIEDKFAAFGWNALLINGNDLEEIEKAVECAKATKGKPTAIVCKTIKGKGVSYMENSVGWHGKAPNDAEYEQAMTELKAQLID